MTKQYLRPDEVATMLNVSVRTIQYWAQKGKLPAVKLNGLLRIPAAELEKVMQHQRVT